jgi:hypothetical protein
MFEVIPGYTRRVKTAISIPDETFARAERQAAALGMSRSEFFTRAVRRYLEQLEAESLTGRINLAIDMAWPDGVTIEVVQHGEDNRLGRTDQAGQSGQLPAAGGAHRW